MTAATPPRDPDAELVHREFAGYMKARGCNPDLTKVCANFGPGDLRDAFAAGWEAMRDLDAATLAAEVRAGHVRIETGKPAVATPGGPGVTSAKATYGRYRQAMYERGVIVCDWDGLTAEDRESWDAALADAIATPQPAPGLAAPVTVEGVLCRDYPAVVEAMQAALDRRKAVLLKVIGERDKLGRALENVFAVLDRQTRTYAERISYARTLIRTALEGK